MKQALYICLAACVCTALLSGCSRRQTDAPDTPPEARVPAQAEGGNSPEESQLPREEDREALVAAVGRVLDDYRGGVVDTTPGPDGKAAFEQLPEGLILPESIAQEDLFFTEDVSMNGYRAGFFSQDGNWTVHVWLTKGDGENQQPVYTAVSTGFLKR